MNNIFLQGYLVGLAYVAPIGMQNSYIIHSAARSSGKRVLEIALIASALDISLALACFFGVGLLLDRVEILNTAMLGIGAVAVILIGLRLVLSKTDFPELDKPEQSTGRLALALLAVTWFNPQALLDGTLLLGGFKSLLSVGEAPFFIMGVILASATWFFGLAFGVNRMKDFMTEGVLRMVNILCGGLLVFYGGRLAAEFLKLMK